MDKNKSQTRIRLSSLLPTRIEEGLSFSDYFDDSIPYDVKPVPSVTPMQEDDYPTQAKDQSTDNRPQEKGQKGLFMDGMMPEDIDAFKSHLAQLFAYLKEELQLKTVPKVKLVEDEKNAAKILGKTAYYDAENKLIVLYITNRHQKDILRSFAHEVIHHWQHENEKLNVHKGESSPEYAQNNPWLRQMEKQAYLLGNMLFRDWEDKKKAKDRKSGKKMVEADQSPIPPETPYGVIDAQTKKVVFRTTYVNRNRARRFADKKDLEYGAHRYIPIILRPEYLKERALLIGKQYPPKKTDYRG